MLCAVMILVNSIVIGYEVQWLTTNEAEPAQTKILGLCCSIFFLIELVLRVVADGTRYFFFLSDHKNWNWFDFALVAMSLFKRFDVVSMVGVNNGEASMIGKGIKTIKMLRIIRVVRVFRFFRELSQLAFMIMDSVKSLVWALVMLAIVIYVFAIFFTHYAAEHVRLQGTSHESILIDEHFGNLWLTIYTLFHCMLNGISWYTIPVALYTIPGWTGPFLAFGFVGYLAFTMLTVMNIQMRCRANLTQRDILVQKEMEVKEHWLKEMRKVFLEMDSDCSESLTQDEVAEFCADDRVHYYLTALGLDNNDTQKLFDLLDDNQDGQIELDEFLAGCLRLKGMARSIDVLSLIRQSRQVHRRLDEIDRVLRLSMQPSKHLASVLRPSSSQEPLPDGTLPETAPGGGQRSVPKASMLGLQAW
ncbi:unnamed protein product, partial [Prorocentrum cordatum]